VEGVYLLVFSEEFIKLFVMMKRFLSRKWIHDLVGA
jgi:Na+-driven multidrug efflux pump